MKVQVQIAISLISLLSLLTYTLVHTGSLLSRYVHPSIVGYIAAFGIEVAVISLSLRIGQLRRSKDSSGFFIFVLFAVVFVSAIANVAEGFSAIQSESLTIGSLRQLDPIQAFIGVSATGLVSLIVLALAEIVGTDVDAAVHKIAQSSEPKIQQPVASNFDITFSKTNTGGKTLSNTGNSSSVEQARAVKAKLDVNNKLQAQSKLIAFIEENPTASLAEIAQVISRSRTTVSNYLQELQGTARIQKSSDGWHVNQPGR